MNIDIDIETIYKKMEDALKEKTLEGVRNIKKDLEEDIKNAEDKLRGIQNKSMNNEEE